MTLAQAAAITAILAFLGFVAWGRSPGGRKSLGPLLRQPEPPQKTRRTARRVNQPTKAVATSRKPAGNPRPKSTASTRRPASKSANKK